MCYYCQRVFQARFKAKYKSVQKLLEQFGIDVMVLRMHKHWRQVCVLATTQAGTLAVKITWGTEEDTRKLVTKQAQETRLEDPEDEIIPEEDYESLYGNWKTNGKGHKLVDWGGVRGVLVPGRRVWRTQSALAHGSDRPGQVPAALLVIHPPLSFLLHAPSPPLYASMSHVPIGPSFPSQIVLPLLDNSLPQYPPPKPQALPPSTVRRPGPGPRSPRAPGPPAPSPPIPDTTPWGLYVFSSCHPGQEDEGALSSPAPSSEYALPSACGL